MARLLPPEQYAETRDLGALQRALAQMVAVDGANVLAVAGGDGSVHHTVHALWQLHQRTVQVTGEAPPWPRILILNGGTLNIVGRSVAIHGPPEQTLRTFLRTFGEGPLSRVPVRPQPMLEVAWQGEAPRLGFVFGSEVTHHALELYARFGAGYWGLTRFLATFAHGAVLGNQLWREESWRLGPYAHLDVVPDVGAPTHFASYTGVVASTADLTLAIGAIAAIRRPLNAPGFAVRVVDAAPPAQLARLVPALMRDVAVPGMADFPRAQRLTLTGAYTLDGETFPEPAPGLPLTVARHPTLLPLVPADAD